MCCFSIISSIISSTCIVYLAGSQIASTCFKKVAPSTAYSNRNDHNSSPLIWSSTGHNFITIFLFVYTEKNTERFTSNSFNYKQDLHGKYSWPSQFSQLFTSKYLPPYCPGICSCFVSSLLSSTSFAILPSQPFPFHLTGLGKFSIFFRILAFPILPLLPTFSFKSWQTFHCMEWPESITLLYRSASCSNN